MSDLILRMKGVTKAFPGVKALDNVDFELIKGEVHALLGENGSGKSTLMKCLGGIYSMDAGEIEIEGETVAIKAVTDAQRIGISIVHQELVNALDMTVADNIFMGEEPKNGIGFIDFKKMNRMAQSAIDNFGAVGIRPETKMRQLSTAQRQIVEIAKALSKGARIVVMDEPTASLTKQEVEQLYLLIEKLKKDGVSVIYISHRMEELFAVSDRVTVLRDGKVIGTKLTGSTNEDELVKMMIGRDVLISDKKHAAEKDIVLEVQNLTRRDEKVRSVSFQLYKGEVLGIAGLTGAGRSELVRSIFGIDPIKEGQILIEGKQVRIKDAKTAIHSKIGLVPESRKEEGLILIQSVRFNTTITVLDHFIKGIRVNRKREQGIVDQYIKRLSIRASSSDQVTNSLSGGNQQKVVMSKWLAQAPKILIMDEPTRGIDVGSKLEIYDLIDELALEGVSLIIVSSELPELIKISDRVGAVALRNSAAAFLYLPDLCSS